MKFIYEISNSIKIRQILVFCIVCSLFIDINAQNNNNSSLKRDIAHNLNAVVPDDALNSDDVVELTINPNWDILTSVSYVLISNPGDIFGISGSKLIISNNSNLKEGQYKIECFAKDDQYYDSFFINVSVISSSKCIYINPSYKGTESGTRDKPYNSVFDPVFKNGFYYLIARGSKENTDEAINVTSNMLIGAYGHGSKPIISCDAVNAVYFSPTDHYTTIRDIRIKHKGSRTIQIDSADHVVIDNCHLGDPATARVDIGVRSDGLTSYTKILNCTIDSVDSDGIYLESEFSEIAYNTITNVSINNKDGDGVQLAINAYKAHVSHNYIEMGNWVTEKGVIVNSQGQSGGYGSDSYAVIEYNTLIASPGYASFGYTSIGKYDTVRCNYIYTEKSAVEAAAVNLADGGYIVNNIIKGWDRGVYGRGDDLTIYNNTITDCARAIDDNAAASNTLIIKNNIFNNITGNYLLSASTNNRIVLDYNLYSPSNTKWTIQGTDYYTLTNLRNLGYELHGLVDDPDFIDNNGNYQLSSGSPAIDKGQDYVKTDFLGISRPQGSSSDIGAYEWYDSSGSIPVAPNIPTGLKVETVDFSSIVLRWTDASNDETGFEIERSGPNDFNIKKSIKLNPNTTSYKDSDVKPNSIYQYRIRAIRGEYHSSYSNSVVANTPQLAPPASPTSLQSNNYTESSVTIMWKDNSSNEDGFVIKRTKDLDPSDVVSITISANCTSYVDNQLSPSTTYIYTIQATNPAGVSSPSNKNVATTISVAESKRIKDGLIAYYNFIYNSDNIVRDLSGFGEPLNLKILNPSSVSWDKSNRLSVNSATTIASILPAKKIISAITLSNEISVECWIKPKEPGLQISSRVVSLGNNDTDIGFALNQDCSANGNSLSFKYHVRLQTESTNESGYPEFYQTGNIAYINLQHLVYVRDSVGEELFYINGSKVAEGFRPSSFDSWKSAYYLRLGNENGLNLPWKGSFYLVAIYNKALSKNEINNNFSAGPCDSLKINDLDCILNVYPNPVSDHATIEIIPNAQNDISPQMSVRVLDIYGSVRFEEVIFNPSQQYTRTFDFRSYTNGVYFLQVISGNKQKSTKLVINK